MKFNAYFVRAEHPDTGFTGTLLMAGRGITVNFKKVETDLFIAHLPRQIDLRFGETYRFKNREKSIRVLLPLMAKYNRRKLKKITDITRAIDSLDFVQIALNLLTVEKWVTLQPLLSFFGIKRQDVLGDLIDLEQNQKIKIIDLNTLHITSYEEYLEYLAKLRHLVQHYQQIRQKTIPFSEIESSLKLSQHTIFFKYLLNSLEAEFAYKILADKVLLHKVSLSEKEKRTIEAVTELLRRNRLSIFAMDQLNDLATLDPQEINDALWYLVDDGVLIQMDGRCFIFEEDLNRIINRLKKFKRNQGDMIDIQSLRELTAFNRKSIIALLEYLDTQGITQRVGNARKILLGV